MLQNILIGILTVVLFINAYFTCQYRKYILKNTINITYLFEKLFKSKQQINIQLREAEKLLKSEILLRSEILKTSKEIKEVRIELSKIKSD